MKLFVTGTDGYIGVQLASFLINRGHTVFGIDTGFYRDGWLYHGIDRFAQTNSNDIRRIREDDLRGYDAVVHLAELSNDPLGQLNPDITYKINHAGSVALARAAKKAGIQRFIYTSSCSVYSIGGEDMKFETSPIDPQTAYAKCKAMVERDVGPLADDGFSPTFLRNATAFGVSPRMRFDIVLNNLAGLAWTTREIKMVSDGTPWRPLVHVRDICKAVACALEAPRDAIHNEIFNVGDTRANYRVKEIAQFVADAIPGCQLSFGKHDPDNRSYKVSFDKIHKKLPGFSCDFDAAAGARELASVFKNIDMAPETFNFRAFTRLKQLEYLIRTRQIDEGFFWREPDEIHTR